jgi:hypothetical protein
MDGMVYCLVDASGRVFTTDGAESYADLAAAAGLEEQACRQYRFELATRRLFGDRGDSPGEDAVRAYLDHHFGTPAKLMKRAEEGRLPKLVLASLLAAGTREPYLDACALIEKQHTDDCAAANDPCLESGCAVEGEGEICLQPLLRAGTEYDRACADEWLRLFTHPRHRVEAWTRA